MSTTTDLITAAAILGPTALATAAYALSIRGAAAESAGVRAVLALSAYERAQAAEQDDTATPPDGGEPLPEPAPVVHLAPVVDLAAWREAA
ncbi:hypothetical protein Kpho02_07410 [Kitasatospora phosalacinea]|uniref:Uncharacterized protein n=1 Tax=Kitasatospora phosalacinea TaxID=2065 RepID=A0A9W6Q5B1_9ACTN|nr:hypothetical protein [Kitasatospora phosalacinea]GLW68442.1 hypothetical protein Kpho02_07410 [Kitasatospora phosalacinea]